MALDFTAITQVIEDLIPWDTVRITDPSTGPRVFDTETGQYTYPEPETLYEGRGAVQTAGTAAEVIAIPGANLPWAPETRSKYRLLTPLDAPVAEKDQIVSVVAIHEGGDLALLGRKWRVQDPGGAGTIAVVRTTALDQIQQTRQVT
ncbi:DUF6093 family protein [Streptomyces sp. NBC_00878]|uniref:DUF6093 family protein n=1 Tax=Streptomyces sp. NBC_00878 TaxID=2975854 RepID=UPI00224DCF9D|nr:DUF6093 family protein [Streptomyces sp. NBC_00878]MCX4911804.1 DUF6093 family protein [Streptomyces sp. NBC_00878]